MSLEPCTFRSIIHQLLRKKTSSRCPSAPRCQSFQNSKKVPFIPHFSLKNLWFVRISQIASWGNRATKAKMVFILLKFKTSTFHGLSSNLKRRNLRNIIDRCFTKVLPLAIRIKICRTKNLMLSGKSWPSPGGSRSFSIWTSCRLLNTR